MSDQGPYPGYPGQDPGQQPQQPPQYPQAPPPGYQQQPMPYGYGYPPPRNPDQRPGKLTAAAVITWIGAGLMGFMFVLLLIGGLLVPQGELDEALREQLDGRELPFSVDALRQGLIITGLIGTAWCAAACVFAGMMLKKQNGARIMLAISAGATILLSITGITAVVPLLFTGAAIAVLVLIFNREVNAWFRGDSPTAGMPPYQQPYPPQQPPQQPPSGSGGPW